LQDKYLEYI